MGTHDGKLATKVHRKTIQTNWYLNYHSAHSNEQKQGVKMNSYNQAQLLITKSTDRTKEKDFYFICSLKMIILNGSYKNHRKKEKLKFKLKLS